MPIFGVLLFTGIWGFMWLLCFSYLTSKWRRTEQYFWKDTRSTVEAPLAFAFFCLIIYVRAFCFCCLL